MLPVTSALIAANVAIFLLQNVFPGLVIPFALWPWGASQVDAQVGFAPWQIVTYAFLHGNFNHLFFNALALWMFLLAQDLASRGRRKLLARRLGSPPPGDRKAAPTWLLLALGAIVLALSDVLKVIGPA